MELVDSTGIRLSLQLQCWQQQRIRHSRLRMAGRSIFHHVRDVAAGFIRGVRAPLSIALAANIPGESVSIGELIEMIYAHAPNAVGKLSYDMREPDAVEFLDDPTLETLIGPLRSPTFERVGETIHEFRSLLAASRITFP